MDNTSKQTKPLTNVERQKRRMQKLFLQRDVYTECLEEIIKNSKEDFAVTLAKNAMEQVRKRIKDNSSSN